MEERLKKFLFNAGGSYKPKAVLYIETLASKHRIEHFTLFNGYVYVSTPGLLFCFSGLPCETKKEILEKLSGEVFIDRNLF